ncbi:hypothetical protein IJG11_02215 [Candidatus Saccharibacteria bacterium]|nr:hypothetical protein [Candidatus Saccharibacteria bacterium]
MDGEDESNNERRGLFDPVRDALDEIKSGAKPDFVGNDSGRNSGLGGVKKKASSSGAVDGLRSAEKSAAGGTIGQSSSGIGSAREKETKASGFYSGSGKSSGGKSSVGGKKKAKGWLKKGGPMGLIIALIVGVGGIMGGSQLFQPFSLVAQFQETFNSMQVSANTRSSKFFRLQMDSGRIKDPVKGTIFGKTFSITNKQKERLKQQGIEYDEEFEIDGKKTKVLKYDDGSGDVKIITAKDFDDVYASDADFHRAYNAGSMTWRGQIANWFGTRVTAFLKNNNLTRNMFNDYESKKAELDGDGLAAVKETLDEKVGDIDNEGEKTQDIKEEEDEDSGTTKHKGEDSDTDSGKLTRGDTSSLKKKMDSIESKFSASANAVCGISNAVGAITMAVTAAEALQIINLATAYFEAADKVKAGYGDDAPIHELSMTLNEKQKNTNEILESVSMSGDGSSESDYSATTKEVTTEKTAMEAEGVAALYSGGKVNASDASVQSFNLTSSISKIMGGISSSMAAFQTCTIAKLVTSAVEAGNALLDGIGCIIGIVTAETGVGAAVAVEQCGELIVDIGISIGKGVLISVAIAGVFSAIAPVLTKAWTRDLISNLGGEDLGNALTSGGNMYLGGAHRANGGSPATRGEYESYAVAQHQVMEDYARYERESLGPFDMTSKYTFMGTLMTQLMNFTSANSLMSAIISGGSVVTNSIVALSPMAAAYDVANTLPSEEEYEKTCPYLASIGVIGDAYCNPYVMTDMSTINTDPVDVINTINNDYKGFAEETTSDGNVKISGDSELAKYIVYCDGRTSMFGVTDYNIVSNLNSSTSANTGNTYTDAAVDGAIGAIPIIGDGLDVVENINSLNNLGYISGESCVAGNTVDNVSAPDWEEAKYYQRFIEDQSLAESMGVIEKSAVTAYLEEYYKENPLDNSYEGMLARYSGLDKETVSDILYIARYYEYVNNYNPAERYAFGVPVVDTEKELKFDNENVMANNFLVVLADKISYADVRNRSFAV